VDVELIDNDEDTIEETDKYRENEVCEICNRCRKLFFNCAGKNAAVYADSGEFCWNFAEKSRLCETGKKLPWIKPLRKFLNLRTKRGK
jgi:hypothetical protein